ncbi:hypothetical protein VPIG_00005 [Vibrio phage PWH3a-P1]|uniref:hypothetical protein n=1 Tax=Vibrio phage PWH3a-P1 TaxID=754058 RepID=UPI0002C049FC|nr:hypothetical protein VPIG_00005 [Vibrio phage PWH3a-P1]AGH31863.1 hypothetical protein VPIG_00005 [Vibrio phage PWH3a-P1]
MYITPVVVSPEYLRDNQYNTSIKVVDPDYNVQLFQDLMDEYGIEMLSYFPSGKEVFFCVRGCGYIIHRVSSKDNKIENLTWSNAI